ncbi:protein of unknown function [Serratia sp. Tan611]|nr:protein of unknown function [Serratia sp. Tan611]
MKVPTGGKSPVTVKARERSASLQGRLEVSRSGVIPGPTVIVRMGESNGICRACARLRYFWL